MNTPRAEDWRSRGGHFSWRPTAQDARPTARIEHLVLSNGNIFLPLSNLTQAQRRILDADSGPQIAAALSAPVLAAGLGATTFTRREDRLLLMRRAVGDR